MAAMKCGECAYWSFQYGCKLERQNYYQFRDCMTGKKDYSFPKDNAKTAKDTQNIREK